MLYDRQQKVGSGQRSGSVVGSDLKGLIEATKEQKMFPEWTAAAEQQAEIATPWLLYVCTSLAKGKKEQSVAISVSLPSGLGRPESKVWG